MINLRGLRIAEREFACKRPPARYRVLRCTQNLHKSTYEGNAFKRGHTYVVHPDRSAEHLVYVVDETGHPFSFLRVERGEPSDHGLYRLTDYFDIESHGSTPGVV